MNLRRAEPFQTGDRSHQASLPNDAADTCAGLLLLSRLARVAVLPVLAQASVEQLELAGNLGRPPFVQGGAVSPGRKLSRCGMAFLLSASPGCPRPSSTWPRLLSAIRAS
jgi:hypothetical protein